MPREQLSVAVIDSLEAASAIEREWSELYRASERATAFQSPAWVLGWLRHAREARPRIVVARRSGRLVGIAPFAADPAGLWTLAGTGPSDVLDLLARDVDAPEAAAAALAHVGQLRDWGALELHELREDSALLAAARAGLAGVVVADTPLSISPVVPIPDEASTLEAIVPSAWARRVRYDTRACERAGLRIEVGADPLGDVRAWARLHAARWNARGQQGVLTGRDAFVEAVMPRLIESGDAEVLALRDDRGAVRASALIFRERSRAAYYLGGFDPAVGRRSPLVVLIGAALERVARRGARELDFLRGAEPYKYRWGAVDRTQRRLRIHPHRG